MTAEDVKNEDNIPSRRVPTPTDRTVVALLSRGIDSSTATSLKDRGITVSALSTMTTVELSDLGLTDAQIELLHADGRRPPIPLDTVYELLFRSRSTCCHCRRYGRPYIIHHIEEWSRSRSHEMENLVVLCLNCHGEAHTKHDISRNLTGDVLLEMKKRWLRFVAEADREAALSRPSGADVGFWDYFNHSRIFDVLSGCSIAISDVPYYRESIAAGQLGKDGALGGQLARGQRFLYDGTLLGANPLYHFTLAAIQLLLGRCPPVCVTFDYNRRFFHAVARPGMIIALKGRYFFRCERGTKMGPGQPRRGLFRRRGVLLKFTVDSWEMLTNSAYISHCSGGAIVTAILCIRSIESVSRDGRKGVEVGCTCLAIGSGVGPTNYPKSVGKGLRARSDEAEDWDGSYEGSDDEWDDVEDEDDGDVSYSEDEM